MLIELITLNFDTSAVQEKILHGEEYYVVPAAMMVPGVFNDLFYSEEELSKWTPSWNHKPIVVNHPSGGLACNQEFLNEHSIGLLMDATFNGKQRASAWINKSRALKREPRIVEAIKNKRIMEVSTGLIVDKIEKTGMFGGRSYKHEAVNHRPDHLAILPDKIGACSTRDGAGLMQLNSDERSSLTKDIAQEVVSQLRPHFSKGDANMAKKDWIDTIIKNTERTNFEESDRKYLEGLEDKRLEKMAAAATKKPAVEFNTQEEYDAKLKEELDKKVKEPDFIKELKKKQEDELTANEKAEKEKKDKEKEGKKPQTMEEYLNSVPPEFRAVVTNGLKAEKQIKDNLIGIIVANKANSFTKEWLATQELGTLQAMAALAASTNPETPAAPQYNYMGVAAPPPQLNQHKEEGLDSPVYNDKDFGKIYDKKVA